MLKPFAISLIIFLFVSTLGFGCSSLIYYPNSYLYINVENLEYKPVEHIFRLDDGSEIIGWYFKSKLPKSHAVVLFFHGNGQNRSSHIRYLYWLLKEGYDIAVFDYPGYGETEGRPNPKNTVQMGKKAISYVKELNPDLPLVVYGHSLGGVIAARSVWEQRGKIQPQLLVIDSSFLSYQQMGRTMLRQNFLTWIFQPLTYLVLSDDWSAKGKLHDLAGLPIVVIHSREDEIIPFARGEQVFAEAKEPKHFITKQKGTHFQAFDGTEGPGIRAKLLQILPK